MQVLTSQLSGDGTNADRVMVTDNAVVVLDGASAFVPVPVDPGEYAETLGYAVARRLASDPAAPIAETVAEGISTAARLLDLYPGRSPSSTIAILRTRDGVADLFVLGDSPIYYGTPSAIRVLRDDRLSTIAEPQRESYVAALRAGRGYGTAHHDALVALQQVQREHRNRVGGYWIAEADPSAAHRGYTATVEPSEAAWAVLGTDGATDLLSAVDPGRWPEIADYDQEQLNDLLAHIHRWESDTDPIGQRFPRAKPHDDKTLAVVPHVFPSINRPAETARRRPAVRPLPNLPL